MNVFAVWLGACREKCVALFASKGAGAFRTTKSTKRNGGNISKGAAVENLTYRFLAQLEYLLLWKTSAEQRYWGGIFLGCILVIIGLIVLNHFQLLLP